MAVTVELTEVQKVKKANYEKNGWPKLLTSDDLVIYMGRRWATIQKYYASRPDWPVMKIGEVWGVPLDVWQAFLSAVYTGRVFEGLREVEYGAAIKLEDEEWVMQ